MASVHLASGQAVLTELEFKAWWAAFLAEAEAREATACDEVFDALRREAVAGARRGKKELRGVTFLGTGPLVGRFRRDRQRSQQILKGLRIVQNQEVAMVSCHIPQTPLHKLHLS